MFLHRLAGGRIFVCREDFDHLWVWYFPFMFAMLWPALRDAWDSKDCMYIRGLITREEAEDMLLNSEVQLSLFVWVVRYFVSL